MAPCDQPPVATFEFYSVVPDEPGECAGGAPLRNQRQSEAAFARARRAANEDARFLYRYGAGVYVDLGHDFSLECFRARDQALGNQIVKRAPSTGASSSSFTAP